MAWPKGMPRAGHVAKGNDVSEFEPGIGHNSGRAVALGRSGEELTRQRTISSDIFDIPREIVPDGWDYQWNVLEVTGQLQTAQRLAMGENGWRPVPADRHPGRYMMVGHKGEIIRDGLILEERPMILTEEAKREEYAKAVKLDLDQKEQLMLSKKGALGNGFSDDPKYRGTGGMARRTYAPDAEIRRPQLEIDHSA